LPVPDEAKRSDANIGPLLPRTPEPLPENARFAAFVPVGARYPDDDASKASSAPASPLYTPATTPDAVMPNKRSHATVPSLSCFPEAEAANGIETDPVPVGALIPVPSAENRSALVAIPVSRL
jgi:hypothetical protein